MSHTTVRYKLTDYCIALPIADEDHFGLIKLGTGFTQDPDGTINVSGGGVPADATISINGDLQNLVDNPSFTLPFVKSVTTGEPTGSDVVSNMVSLTQAEYTAGVKSSTTFYIITDA